MLKRFHANTAVAKLINSHADEAHKAALEDDAGPRKSASHEISESLTDAQRNAVLSVSNKAARKRLEEMFINGDAQRIVSGFKQGSNDASKTGDSYLWATIDALIRFGSLSKSQLNKHLQKVMGWSAETASARVSLGVQIACAMNIATTDGKQITASPTFERDDSGNAEPTPAIKAKEPMTITANTAISVRSDFSIGESCLQIGTLVKRAKEVGWESVALVDIMTISGMVGFFKAASKEGIKPVIGCTLRVFDDPTYRKPKKGSGEVEKANRSYFLKVYVKSEKGLASLMALLSKGASEEYFYYTSRVGLEDVLNLEDVIVTTGDFFSLFHHPDHREILQRLSGRLKTYVEIVPLNTPLWDTLNKLACSAAYDLNLPIVGDCPVLYSSSEDADSLDVLKAITSNTELGSIWLPKQYSRDLFPKQGVEGAKAIVEFAKRAGIAKPASLLVLECLASRKEILDACTYEFRKLEPCLPSMATDEFATMVVEVKKGWAERFASPVLGHQPQPFELAKYRDRLAYELGVLKKMGFSGYFLLVQEIVKWSKQNDIAVGPGRGSVGGSLVAYLMGITDVDPIRFNLLFERFINPSRTDLPDADLDFMSSRRHEVIAHIVERYGQENVAGISNYSTLGAASALRDVSRMHGLSPIDYACSKQMEKEHGVSLSLTESAERVPDIAKFKEKYPAIWDHSIRLEGAMRQLGQHAAGVVIAGEPVVKRAAIETRTGGPVTNWDKTMVEDFGLIKIDVLGLTTLDILKKAAVYIEERHGTKIDYLRVPLDDGRVMGAFSRAETVSVFQFEGGGMRTLLKNLSVVKPLTFDDITAATALFRPGPIDAGLLDQYVAVKQELTLPSYEHPTMKAALEETYGVIVYQEQVQRVCIDLSGFSSIDADHVRRAMGKKDKEKMSDYKEKFVRGATAGRVEVTLEDGSKVVVHRERRFKCADGKERTVEEMMSDGVDIPSLT